MLYAPGVLIDFPGVFDLKTYSYEFRQKHLHSCMNSKQSHIFVALKTGKKELIS
jgi:hypothetical protein